MYSMPGGSCYTTSENQVLILHAMVQKTQSITNSQVMIHKGY